MCILPILLKTQHNYIYVCGYKVVKMAKFVIFYEFSKIQKEQVIEYNHRSTISWGLFVEETM